MSNLEWLDRAACAGHPNPDLFFPSDGGRVIPPPQLEEARRICLSCPVLAECAEHRRRTGATTGVWGAATVRDIGLGKSAGGPQHTARLHGSDYGYREHYRRGEKPCGPCIAAHSAAGSPGGRSKTKRWSA